MDFSIRSGYQSSTSNHVAGVARLAMGRLAMAGIAASWSAGRLVAASWSGFWWRRSGWRRCMQQWLHLQKTKVKDRAIIKLRGREQERRVAARTTAGRASLRRVEGDTVSQQPEVHPHRRQQMCQGRSPVRQQKVEGADRVEGVVEEEGGRRLRVGDRE